MVTEALPRPLAQRTTWRRLLGRDFGLGWLLLLPVLAVLAGLVAYPFILAIVLSFTDKMIGRPAQFVGLQNYRDILTSAEFGPIFRTAVRNTVVYTVVAVACKSVLGMGMALFLNEPFRGRNLMRAICFLPWTTSPRSSAATPSAASSASASGAASSAATSNVAITGSMTLTKYPLKANKITAWAWQSFSPDADRFIASQAQAWGKANGGQVEYDVVQNSVFTQKRAAAIEAKTVPDVLMLSNVLYYQGLNILADMTDTYNKLNKLEGGFYQSFLPGIQADNMFWSIPIEAGPSPLFARLDLIEQATGKREPPKTLDEMEDIAKKVNKPTAFFAIGWTLGRTPDGEGNTTDILHNDGGYLVNKDGTKPAIMSDGTIAGW